MRKSSRARKVIAAACGVGLALGMAALPGGQAQAQNNGGTPPAPGSLGTLVDAVTAPAAVLDPMFSNSATTREIDSHVFDELVTYNQHYEITPDLASSWSSTGKGLDWTFHLVQGAKFQNGEPVTGADVVASLERFMAIGVNGPAMAKEVKSVTSPSPSVVDIALTRPDEDFLATLANPLTFVAVMPAKYAASRTALKPPDLIGTGPYSIEAWIPDQYTLLKRFPGYVPLSSESVGGYGGHKVAYYSALKFAVVPNAQTRLLGLESGQFEYAESLPFTAYQALASRPGLKPEVNPTSVQVVWYFNNYQYPTSNVWFRMALAQALNDTAILKVLTSGQSQFYQANPSLFFPTQTAAYDPGVGSGIYNSPDAAKVKADLARAGYKGQPVVVITNQQYQWMYQASVMAVAQWKADGINAKLDVMTWPGELTYLTKKTGFNLFASGNTLRFDPIDETSNIGTGGADDWGFSNKEIDSLLTAYSQARSASEQKAIVDKLQVAFWKQVPELQVGDMASLDGASASLHGYSVWYLPRFWNVW
ncbi:MAG: ABC transporter substrate-binding protein [Rhodospirillales bacterium]|nr:ABC transporter substrate-binding protein [Rhodospirillales bacterium]